MTYGLSLYAGSALKSFTMYRVLLAMTFGPVLIHAPVSSSEVCQSTPPLCRATIRDQGDQKGVKTYPRKPSSWWGRPAVVISECSPSPWGVSSVHSHPSRRPT